MMPTSSDKLCIPRSSPQQWLEVCKLLSTSEAISFATKTENLFAKFKVWQRVAVWYDQCALTFSRLYASPLQLPSILINAYAPKDMNLVEFWILF